MFSKMLELRTQRSNLYVSFCLVLTVVYFSSIAYNISRAEIDIIEDEIKVKTPRIHPNDVSMTQYVQVKLRALSTKPWNEVLASPLVRNYLLLFSLLFILLSGILAYVIHKKYVTSINEI